MPEGNGDAIQKIPNGNNKDSSSSATKPSKSCVCPKCGTLITIQIETPCYKRSCPKCETRMLSL